VWAAARLDWRGRAAGRDATRAGRSLRQHAGEFELAERLTRLVPAAEMVASAQPAARPSTPPYESRRDRTAANPQVEGHYHGWLDPRYVNGPGGAPFTGPPTRAKPCRELPTRDAVLVARWNEIEQLRRVLEQHPDNVAAILMEPVACNFGSFEPRLGHLAAVREFMRSGGDTAHLRRGDNRLSARPYTTRRGGAPPRRRGHQIGHHSARHPSRLLVPTRTSRQEGSA